MITQIEFLVKKHKANTLESREIDRPCDRLSDTDKKIIEIFGNGNRWNYILKPLTEEDPSHNHWFTISRDSKLKNKIYGQKYLLKDFLPFKLDDVAIAHLWNDHRCILGMRPGKYTDKLTIDIDRGSPYLSESSIERIKKSISLIGLEGSIITQSSCSGGIHIIFPLPDPLESFYLAKIVKNTLESSGFEIKAGILEAFPNLKSDRHALYNGIRLPLQPGTGAAILDDSLIPISDSFDYFYDLWHEAIACQDQEKLENLIAGEKGQSWQGEKRSHGGSEKWHQILSDRDDLLEKGWNQHGQTNKILGDLARYGVICEGLSGEPLADYIRGTAEKMPGYRKFCGHQKEIGARAIAWARCAEKKYRPHSQCQKSDHDAPLPDPGLSNSDRKKDALDRLLSALREMEKVSRSIANKTQFVRELAAIARSSFTTIGKYWDSLIKPVFDRLKSLLGKDSEEISKKASSTDEIVCNPLSSKDFSDFDPKAAADGSVCNPLPSKDFRDFEDKPNTKYVCEPSAHIHPLSSDLKDKNLDLNPLEFGDRSPSAGDRDFRGSEAQAKKKLLGIIDRAKEAIGLKSPKPKLKSSPSPSRSAISYFPRSGNTIENTPWPSWIPRIYRNKISRDLWHLVGSEKPNGGDCTWWALANPSGLDSLRPKR